jgi:hypothetical protein
LGNCILLPIEAESQDTALRIFSTLNDRGLPLSDADIFKAKFYDYYGKSGRKDFFIEQWKELEDVTARIFKPLNGTPMDELFTRYMYFIRAKTEIRSSTTEALRKFYEKDKYALLKKDETLLDLKTLAAFWQDVHNQSAEKFSPSVLRKLYILNAAPNGMWTYFLSVYFMHNKDASGNLDDSRLNDFLGKTIGFVWGFAFVHPGVNALRTPVYAEMINIVKNQPIRFDEHKFRESSLRTLFQNFDFKNARPLTRSVLTWWAFQSENQRIPELNEKFDIEHIFPKKRQENDKSLSESKMLEFVGNKTLLEEKINIRASDYRFVDKKKYYLGFTNDKGQKKNGSSILEVSHLATILDDFSETQIIERSAKILDSFIDFLKREDLLVSH